MEPAGHSVALCARRSRRCLDGLRGGHVSLAVYGPREDTFLIAEYEALRRQIELEIRELGEFLRYGFLTSKGRVGVAADAAKRTSGGCGLLSAIRYHHLPLHRNNACPAFHLQYRDLPAEGGAAVRSSPLAGLGAGDSNVKAQIAVADEVGAPGVEHADVLNLGAAIYQMFVR